MFEVRDLRVLSLHVSFLLPIAVLVLSRAEGFINNRDLVLINIDLNMLHNPFNRITSVSLPSLECPNML